MNTEETSQYVSRHMSNAGSAREIFTEPALGVMYEYSHGLPRKINHVATAALMAAASQKKNIIDDYLMREVIASEFDG
jgi:type II secretory pathway predicted ATPase ExeA